VSLEIPNSAVAKISVNLSAPNASFGATANSIIADLQSELVFDGLTIAQSDIGLSGISFPLTGNFTAELQILNQSGQELDDTDLLEQFTAACSDLGLQLNSFAVLQIIGAGGNNSGTGTQGNVTTTGAGTAQGVGNAGGIPACGDPNLSFWKYPQQWVQCLTQKGLSTVGLLAIGLLVGVILIVAVERRP
jgi:hypothetical protein